MGSFDARKQQLGVSSSTGGDSPFAIRRAQLTPLSSTQQHALDVEQSDMAQINAAQQSAMRDQSAQEQAMIDAQQLDNQARENALNPNKLQGIRPYRDAPVVGPVLRGLDVVADNPIVQKVGEIGRDFYVPGAGAANIAGYAGAAGEAISRIAPKFGTSLGGRVLQSAAKEAAVGVPLATGQALTSQTDNLGEAAKAGAVGGTLGAGLGALSPALGKVFSTYLNRAKPQQIPEIEQMLTEQSAQKQPTFRLASNNEALDSVMGKIKPVVQERMTPPLENQNELAKWVHGHLGVDSISLNEVRKLPYEDLRQMAEMIRPQMSVSEEAIKAARELGYDLPTLLEGKGQNLGAKINRNAAERVAGVYPETLPKVKAPEFQPVEVAPPEQIAKPGLISRLLGDQSLGINAFAKQGGEYTNPMDTRSRIVSKTKIEPTTLENKLTKGYAKSFDNLQRINRLDKAVENAAKTPLHPSERAYMQALNSRGSDMVSKHILTEQLVDSKGNAIGNSLKSITQQLPKSQLTNFEDYLINRDAVGRMERGIEVFPDSMDMTTEKMQQKIAEYEANHPEFKKIAQQLYDFKNRMGKSWLVDTGILSPEQWDAFQKTNPVHVPLRRQFSDIELTSPGKAKRGFANQSNPVKKAVGSERKIISPLESIIEDVDRWVKTAKRNEVMQTVIKNIQKAPDELKGWAEIVKQPEEATPKISADGEGLDDIIHQFNETFDKSLKKPDLTKGNIIKGLINGKPVYLRVHDPQLLEALTFLKPQAQNVVVNAARQATRVMKLLTTGANPVFGLARNIFRDIPMAYVSSKTTNNPVRFGLDLLDGFVSALGNRDLYQRFKAVGGGHSSSIAADRNLLAQSKRAILPQKLTPKTLGGKALGAVENLNNALESAPRLGEFKRITKQGGNSYDSKIKGLYEANDVTVNFNRSGEYSKDIDAFVPYFNAALQGLDKLGRMFKDNPVQATTKAVAAITVPQILAYVMNHDNPDYQKLSNYLKDNYILLPLGDGTFFKVAKPREAGQIFGSAVERALRMWNEKDPEAFKDFAESIKTAFLPPVVGGAINKEPLTGALRDTIAGPAVDVGMNRNFVDAPIVPGYLQNVSPRYQYDQNTSELSKKVGDMVNYSPMKLDYLIKSYGGVVGQIGIPANAQGAKVGETLQKLVTADPLYSNDLVRNFYDEKTKLDTAQYDFKQTGDKSNEYNNQKRLQFNRVSDKMSEIRKQMRSIEQNTSFTDEQRKSKLREMQKKINDLAAQAMTKQ